MHCSKLAAEPENAMADSKPPQVTPIAVGETLFLFEGEVVKIYGSNGTEATLPVADLESFVARLSEESNVMASGET